MDFWNENWNSHSCENTKWYESWHDNHPDSRMNVHAYFTGKWAGVQKLLLTPCTCRKQNSPAVTRSCPSSATELLGSGCSGPSRAWLGEAAPCSWKKTGTNHRVRESFRLEKTQRSLGPAINPHCQVHHQTVSLSHRFHTEKLNMLRKLKIASPDLVKSILKNVVGDFQKADHIFQGMAQSCQFQRENHNDSWQCSTCSRKGKGKTQGQGWLFRPLSASWSGGADFCSLLWKLSFALFSGRWNLMSFHFVFFLSSWFFKAKAELPGMTLELKHIPKYLAESVPLEV